MAVSTDRGVIQESELRARAGLGLESGGQSIAVTMVFDGADNVFILKRYDADTLTAGSRSALESLIAWRNQLGAQDRAELDSRATWPRAVVINSDEVVGVLLNIAPRGFWMEHEGQTQPRDIGVFGWRDRSGREFHAAPRGLAALGHLLQTILFLNERGVIVGDLHPVNVLAQAGESVTTYLLDTDAVVLNGRSALQFAEQDRFRDDSAANWPVGGFSVFTDRYKWARIAAMVLGRNPSLRLPDMQVESVTTERHFELLWALIKLDPSVTDYELSALTQAWGEAVSEGQEFVFAPNNLLPIRSTEPSRGSAAIGTQVPVTRDEGPMAKSKPGSSPASTSTTTGTRSGRRRPVRGRGSASRRVLARLGHSPWLLVPLLVLTVAVAATEAWAASPADRLRAEVQSRRGGAPVLSIDPGGCLMMTVGGDVKSLPCGDVLSGFQVTGTVTPIRQTCLEGSALVMAQGPTSTCVKRRQPPVGQCCVLKDVSGKTVVPYGNTVPCSTAPTEKSKEKVYRVVDPKSAEAKACLPVRFEQFGLTWFACDNKR